MGEILLPTFLFPTTNTFPLGEFLISMKNADLSKYLKSKETPCCKEGINPESGTRNVSCPMAKLTKLVSSLSPEESNVPFVPAEEK